MSGFFFVAHDDRGTPLLHPDVARLGLGAAVIAELLMAGYVDIRNDTVVVETFGCPAEPVAATLMSRLLDERNAMPVRDWLAYLRDPGQPDGDIYDQVAQQMRRTGLIRAERAWSLRRSKLYPPVDQNRAAWSWARISGCLDRRENLGKKDTVLGGLILATDLHSRILLGSASSLESKLRHHISAAPEAVRELLRHAENAVSAAVSTVA
ncbi:GOLPH3/VPS74 family protein [Nucisporomicrobium flavum]|uniref:GOLPH3/VPS74 family protein n=1 Tax=Nucisporomicrobium flavum TaxID=2785915 RepID=UPI0018F31C51|nr:GPP34 family phosphoprotein [Nucisporomicrobium flavum]